MAQVYTTPFKYLTRFLLEPVASSMPHLSTMSFLTLIFKQSVSEVPRISVLASAWPKSKQNMPAVNMHAIKQALRSQSCTIAPLRYQQRIHSLCGPEQSWESCIGVATSPYYSLRLSEFLNHYLYEKKQSSESHPSYSFHTLDCMPLNIGSRTSVSR